MASIVSNTATAYAGRVVNLLIGFFVISLLTQYLGAERYGLYVLLLAWGAMLQTVADFGLYLTLTREAAQDAAHEQGLFSLILTLRLVLLVLVFGLGTAIWYTLPDYRPLLPVFGVVLVGLLFQSISQLLMSMYQKYGVVWQATIGDVVGRVVQAGAIILLFREYVSLLSAVSAFAAGTAVAWAVHTWFVPKVTIWRVAISWPRWKHIVAMAWPLALLSVLNIVYFRIDTIMLSFFRPPEEVGWYGLAYGIIERGLFFPAMFGGLILPQLSLLLVSRRKSAQKLLEQSLQFMFISVGIAAALLIVFAEPLIRLLARQSFASFVPAVSLLQILSLALVIMFFGNIFGYALVALRKQKHMLWLYAALAAGNTLLNLLLIPRFGATAAAWTTVLTEGVAMLAAARMVWRVIPYQLSTVFLIKVMTIILSVGWFAFLLPDTWHVIIRLVIVGCLYALGLVVVGVLHPSRFSLLFENKR